MEPDDVSETTKIANLRILVEQVIWWLKYFTILADEMEMNQLQYADDVLKACVALSNLRKPYAKTEEWPFK